MITQTYTLSLQPGGVPLRVPCVQGDTLSRTLTFSLTSGGTAASLPTGADVLIAGTKPDGKAFTVSGTLSGSTATVTLTEQMAVLPGEIPCQLTIISGTEILGTARFLLCVQPSAISDDPDLSETDLSAIAELRDNVVAAKAAAEASATDAADSAGKASVSASAAASSASSAAEAAQNAVDGKADKVTPSVAGNVATLTEDGNLADSGLKIESGTWTPVSAGVSAYTNRSGQYIKIGDMAVVSFYVSGTFSSTASGGITISGCPVKPTIKAAGGGYLNGYLTAENMAFYGWILSADTGYITPTAQWVTSAGNKYAGTVQYAKGVNFEASGTIAFRIA